MRYLVGLLIHWPLGMIVFWDVLGSLFNGPLGEASFFQKVPVKPLLRCIFVLGPPGSNFCFSCRFHL